MESEKSPSPSAQPPPAPSTPPSAPLPRPVIGVAVGLAVALVVGVIVASRLLGGGAGDGGTAQPAAPARTGPVALGPVPAPKSGAPECATLLAALPATLPGDGQPPLARAQLADPAPPATVAWTGSQSEPVVLRCGLDRPAELRPDSRLSVVDGVQWLPVQGADATTWYLVDRPVYVALTIPADVGTGPLQDVSSTVGRALTAVPLTFN